MTDEEYEIRKCRLEQEISRVSNCIENFDEVVSSPKELVEHYNSLSRLKEEVEDIINELEVDDFIENGSRMTNQNI